MKEIIELIIAKGLDISGLYLIQWPGATGVESVYPRCVIFHRLFNLLGVDYTPFNVTLPFVDKKSSEKLQRQLVDLPVLIDKGVAYKNTDEIVRHILGKFEDDIEKQDSAKKVLKAQNVITYQWANEVFLNTLLYARWLRPCNFKPFIKNVEWGNADPNFFRDSIADLRTKVDAYMSRFLISKLSEGEYLKLLTKQLNALELIFKEQELILPGTDRITQSDLAIFMVIQGLLSDDLGERQVLLENYPNILRWAVDVDKRTQGKHTRPIMSS